MIGTGFGEASGCPKTCSKGDHLVFSKPPPFFTLCDSAHDDGNIVAATATDLLSEHLLQDTDTFHFIFNETTEI